MSNDSTHSTSSDYGYTPSLAWCVVYIVLFSIIAIIHTALALRSKYWIIIPTLVLGCVSEIIGWSGRLWSSKNVLLITPFLVQICTLIIAPVFFSAYDYTLLGLAITKLGPQYSLLRPTLYIAFFLTADIISLILQAVGGGQAASQAADGTPTQNATNIMVAGIIFQLISMVVFMSLGLDFVLRCSTKRPYAFQERRIARLAEMAVAKRREEERARGEEKVEERNGSLVPSGSGSEEGVGMGVGVGTGTESGLEETRVGMEPGSVMEIEAEGEVDGMSEDKLMKRWWILLVGVLLSSLMIIIRGVYRSIELKQGWNGFLITHQIYQNLLDGLPMVLAVGIYILFHPMFLLPQRRKWGGLH